MITAEQIYEEVQKDGSIKYYLRTRKFLGKTEDFDSKEEQAFEKAHLKAYLKGKRTFTHKFRGSEDNRKPAVYETQQGLFLVPLTEEEVTNYRAKKNKKILVEQ